MRISTLKEYFFLLFCIDCIDLRRLIQMYYFVLHFESTHFLNQSIFKLDFNNTINLEAARCKHIH